VAATATATTTDRVDPGIRNLNPTDGIVVISSKKLGAMKLGKLKTFAAKLGYDLEDCETLGQARTRLLSSALEFKNIRANA